VTSTWKVGGRVAGYSLGIAVGVVLALSLSGLLLASTGRSSGAHSEFTFAGGAPEQWAFGGSASGSFSCSTSTCHLGNLTNVTDLTLSWNYAISWVVIYTLTNISSSQTQVEVQSALSASISYSVSECVNETMGSPCSQISLSLNLAGKESAVGFTNLTTGTVNLSAGPGSPANVPAWAVTNAQSNESFNFTGSYGISGVSEGGTGTASGSVNFDIGGAEESSVTFSSPLGIVPVSPVPGDAWNASASFSSVGHYSSGYSLSYSYNGQPFTNSSWQSGTIVPSGTMDVNGTDLGTFTLWDNYTNPPTSVTAQEIYLGFSGDEFSAADGWLMVPAELFSGLSSSTVLHPGIPVVDSKVHPSQGGISSLTGGETAFFEHGVGFVGASATGSGSSSPISEPGASTPTVKIQAGPEPVSVAQSQYSGILSGSSSGSSGFPWLYDVVLVVVVVAVVAAVGVVFWRRSARRRRPPVAAYPGAPPSGASVGPVPPVPPGYGVPPPPPGYPVPPPPPPGSG